MNGYDRAASIYENATPADDLEEAFADVTPIEKCHNINTPDECRGCNDGCEFHPMREL